MKRVQSILLAIGIMILTNTGACLADSSASASASAGSASASASAESSGASASSSSCVNANAQAESEATTEAAYKNSNEVNTVEYVYIPAHPQAFAARVPQASSATTIQQQAASTPTNEITDVDVNDLFESLNSEITKLDSQQNEIETQISATETKSVKLLNYYLITLGGLLIIFILCIINLIASLRSMRITQRAIM